MITEQIKRVSFNEDEQERMADVADIIFDLLQELSQYNEVNAPGMNFSDDDIQATYNVLDELSNCKNEVITLIKRD